MRKVINGKRYNTATASYVGEATSSHPVNDFNYWKEELYQKKTGEFFLHGQGGGLSKYAESYGDSKGYGEKLIPLKEDEAKEWVEDHLEAEDYERLFELEDEGQTAFSMTIPNGLYDQLKKRAAKENTTQKEIVIQALLELFSNES